MLTANLSTRPFYNTRVIRAALAALIVVVVSVTLLNIQRYLALAANERVVGADALQAESEATRLRDAASGIVARLDQKEVDAVAAEAKQANAIIDQRAFSWTALLEQLEAALPPDVRIKSIQPKAEADGPLGVSVALEARRIEGVDAFVEALSGRPEFGKVLSTDEQTDEDGLIAAVVESTYAPGARTDAKATDPKAGGAARD